MSVASEKKCFTAKSTFTEEQRVRRKDEEIGEVRYVQRNPIMELLRNPCLFQHKMSLNQIHSRVDCARQ